MLDTPSAVTPVIPASLHELIQSLRHALRDELNSRQTPNDGKPLNVPLCDGHVQSRYGRHQRITFRSPMMPLQGYLHDTQGELVIDGRPHPCVILGLTVDQLTLSLTAELHDYIPEARLTIDRMRLLLTLDKRLANIQAHPQDYLTSLAMKCFSPSAVPQPIAQHLTVAPDPSLNPEQYEALVRAIQHDFCYIWGPPGTGKTMVIGSSTKVAYERGDRTLILANTNAAVDQALEAVLTKMPDAPHGAIIRLGLSADDAPSHLAPVTLDTLTEGELSTLQHELQQLQQQETPLVQQARHLEQLVTLHEDLQRLDHRYAELSHEALSLQQDLHQHQSQTDALHSACTALDQELNQFWAASRWRRLFLRHANDIQADIFAARLALHEHDDAIDQLTVRHQTIQHASDDLLTTRRLLLQSLDRQVPCEQLEHRHAQLHETQQRLMTLHQAITTCQRAMASVEHRLIQRAQILATTITRTYTTPALEQERFDVVIIDEGSMASPPALFTALCLARKQVIIVGDFLQLPPIAESTTKQAKQWLATDIYHLAQITHDQDPRVAALRTQYRMHPDIAAVAARLYQRAGLAYRTDQQTRCARQPLVDHAPIPGKAMAFIDTSDRHPWVEKDHKGSPSNRYHALVALALAKQAIRQATDTPPTISIISPYRNQVRLLQDLIHKAQLTDSVEVGTIHSFQGRQSDIVIFDTTVTGDLTRTMLGRCDSDQSPCKLMNVAFTRGKCKLLVIGHRPSIDTLANVPDSLLWEALHLAAEQESVFLSAPFLEDTTPRTQPVAPAPTPTTAGHSPATTTTRIATPRPSRLYLIRSA
ncbi:MAG: AAA domain-containing protein [Nitrospira sp. BO4]|nr:AAA domain-containing protein [Nitrospira sp. BO4]